MRSNKFILVTRSIRVCEASDNWKCTKSQIRNTNKHKFFNVLKSGWLCLTQQAASNDESVGTFEIVEVKQYHLIVKKKIA